MSSSRTILPRLAQFGEPVIGPEGSLKIKSHQHIAGKIITRGLSRGARKWGESASKLHIGGQDSDVTDDGSDGLDLALSGFQDKSVHLPVIDDGTFHRQTPTPDSLRGNKTPIPGVGYWTKRGGKLRPASVLQELYQSGDDTPNDSKLDLTLTIEGQADPRLLPQRSIINAWKLNKSPDGGTLHPPPTTPDQMHEYDEMFRSMEEDMKQILLCQSFGIMIEKHKSAHGIVATPIFHCPRCLKHWSMFGMPLQNCDNADQPTKGPDFQLNKKNHHILQKFTQLPSKDKEHIIEVIKSPHTSSKSLDPDVSTQSLLILKDVLSEDDDDDHANMFPGSTQDLGSSLIARRASIEVKSQNEKRSSQPLIKLKSQQSIHKQQEHSDQNGRNVTKQGCTKTTVHLLKHEVEKKRKTDKNPANNKKLSGDHQNGQFDTVYDDWSNQKGGHFYSTEEERRSYKHDSVKDRMFDGESGKHKPVGKFTFGSDTSNQISVGLVGPDGGYYTGTYDDKGQFAPVSRINPDGSTCPMVKGPDDMYYPQDDNYHNKAETETSGVYFRFDSHQQNTKDSPDVTLQSDFLHLKEEEQTNLQKFSTLPRDLTWKYEGCSEDGGFTKSAIPGHVAENAATNYNLNHHGEREDNIDGRKDAGDESNQQNMETSTTVVDESEVMVREKTTQEKEDNGQGKEENAEVGHENEITRKENASRETFDNVSECFSSEQTAHQELGKTVKSVTVLEEMLINTPEKDFRPSQHELQNDGTDHKDHPILPSSLGEAKEQKVTKSPKDVMSKSDLSDQKHESGNSKVCLENNIPLHSSLMLVKPNEEGSDQKVTDTADYGSEFSVTVSDQENDIVEEDVITNINTENLDREKKSSEMEAESISKIKTETARIRKSSIVPQMGSKDILPAGSDSYYDAYASSKQGQKGTARRVGKGQRRASIDHRGKVKNPAVKNVTGRPDTKAGALKKHMLATPKSLLAESMSYEINQQKASTSKDALQLPEMDTIIEQKSGQADVSVDKDLPSQKSLLEGNKEIDMMPNGVIAIEESDEPFLEDSEELSPSKQKTKMRRPPKKEKLTVTKERKRVGDQEKVQEEEIKDDTHTEGYSQEEVSKEHQNDLPEIVRTFQDKADSTPLNMKQSLPQISAPLNKKESLTRVKSAAESLEKISLSKFSKFQINLNQSLGLDKPMPESNQASFRMTYSTLPGTFDTRKRSSKSLLREKKQSADKLPSLPTIKKAPSTDRSESKVDSDMKYVVVPKAPSQRRMADSPKRTSTSSSVESEEEESIWESVSEMWMKHSKEMRRFSTLEEYSYLPLTKAFTFSFFEIPFQYMEKNKELNIRGNMIKSMKRPPRMKIKGKKKRPPSAELQKLLEEKRNRVKKQNIVYKLWQMEQRSRYMQPIPKLGSF